LLILTAAETVVAGTLLSALGLSATLTSLAAVAVGASATGLAWLVGHEWGAIAAHGRFPPRRRIWLDLAEVGAGVFLAVNLGARMYYGLRDGPGLLAPMFTGLLLTAATVALMAASVIVAGHAETSEEAELRARLRRVRNELHRIEDYAEVVEVQRPAGRRMWARLRPVLLPAAVKRD
jgi:hypothetical protein